MSPNQHTTQLIDRTIQAFNGDVIAISPMDGMTLIDRWISALHSGDASTNPIASTLSELKMEIQRNNPNTAQVEGLLGELADHAQKAAQQVDGTTQSALLELSSSLKSLGQQISGKRGPANTSGRAPMTSTVGDTSIAGVANVVAPGAAAPGSASPRAGNTENTSTSGGIQDADTGILSPTDTDRVPAM